VIKLKKALMKGHMWAYRFKPVLQGQLLSLLILGQTLSKLQTQKQYMLLFYNTANESTP